MCGDVEFEWPRTQEKHNAQEHSGVVCSLQTHMNPVSVGSTGTRRVYFTATGCSLDHFHYILLYISTLLYADAAQWSSIMMCGSLLRGSGATESERKPFRC